MKFMAETTPFITAFSFKECAHKFSWCMIQLTWIQTETTYFFFDQCSQSFLAANHSWGSVCRQAAQLVKQQVKFGHGRHNLLKQIFTFSSPMHGLQREQILSNFKVGCRPSHKVMTVMLMVCSMTLIMVWKDRNQCTYGLPRGPDQMISQAVYGLEAEGSPPLL